MFFKKLLNSKEKLQEFAVNFYRSVESKDPIYSKKKGEKVLIERIEFKISDCTLYSLALFFFYLKKNNLSLRECFNLSNLNFYSMHILFMFMGEISKIVVILLPHEVIKEIGAIINLFDVSKLFFLTSLLSKKIFTFYILQKLLDSIHYEDKFLIEFIINKNWKLSNFISEYLLFFRFGIGSLRRICKNSQNSAELNAEYEEIKANTGVSTSNHIILLRGKLYAKYVFFESKFSTFHLFGFMKKEV